MATGNLTRFLISAGKQAAGTVFSRSVSSLPSCGNFLYLSSLLRLRPLAPRIRLLYPAVFAARRGFVTSQRVSFARWTRFRSDPNPNWPNRPQRESILLEGCDFKHWLIVVDKPEGDPTRDEIIDSYIKLLAQVVGSEEEARMRIYSVSTRCYYSFGALVPEELSDQLKDLDGVRWVIPDSYSDIAKKDYGGEPFINGQAVPYDPKYHEGWERDNARQARRLNLDRAQNSGTRQNYLPPAGSTKRGSPLVQSKAAGKDILKLSSYYVLSRWTKEASDVDGTLVEGQEDGAISQNLQGFLECMQVAGSNSNKLTIINQKIQIALKEVQELAGSITESKCNTKGSGKRLKGGKEKAMEQGKRLRLCRACGEKAYHDSRNCPTKH